MVALRAKLAQSVQSMQSAWEELRVPDRLQRRPSTQYAAMILTWNKEKKGEIGC